MTDAERNVIARSCYDRGRDEADLCWRDRTTMHVAREIAILNFTRGFDRTAAKLMSDSETEHLLSTEENAARLRAAIDELQAGGVVWGEPQASGEPT